MIKEEKNIDFYTTGRQPSEKEFERISEWIKKDKEKLNSSKQKKTEESRRSHNKSTATSEAETEHH